MEQFEREVIASLKAETVKQICGAKSGSWEHRANVASELLGKVVSAWWSVHLKVEDAFHEDLKRLNRLAGWSKNPQVAYWRAADGTKMLMPPKFFTGDPCALDEQFVASMSLNHAIPADGDQGFARELSDQRNARDNVESNRQFFQKCYRESRFFKTRAPVLHAYAAQTRGRDVPFASDWQRLNNGFAFYLEAFPTRSRVFEGAPRVSRSVLENEVFVCGLNAVVHDVVMRMLRPRRVLLAGKTTWDIWPAPGLGSHGKDVGSREV